MNGFIDHPRTRAFQNQRYKYKINYITMIITLVKPINNIMVLYTKTVTYLKIHLVKSFSVQF